MSGERFPIHVAGIPAGLRCETVGGVDRRRLRKAHQAWVSGEGGPMPPDEPLMLFTGATWRAWRTIAARLGPDALPATWQAAQAGLVEVLVNIDREHGRLGDVVTIRRTAHGAAAHERLTSLAEGTIGARRRDLRELAEQIEDEHLDVANALRNAAPRPTTQVAALLAALAEDLIAGTRHDGSRAFLQAHRFADTKASVVAALRRQGVDDAALNLVGLLGPPRLGFGGALRVHSRDRLLLNASGLPGIAVLPIPPEGLRPSLRESSTALVLVENFQAADALARRRPDAGVAYIAGSLSAASLVTLRHLRGQARTALVPDADLGGVRIAEQVLAVLPAADLLDVGAALGAVGGAPFRKDSSYADRLRRHAGGEGASARLAEAVLQRGYRVEQEHITVRIAERWLER